MSFKELCGYGMPISTMFTNGILRADESGATKIQAPDNAMYNGTSFKTLVAFGLVTDSGTSTPRFLAIVNRFNQVDIVERDPSGDEEGTEFPYYWTRNGDIYTNTESPEIDPTGTDLNQTDSRKPIIGYPKGDGSVFEWDGDTGDYPPSDIERFDSIVKGGHSYWKVDVVNNPLIQHALSSSEYEGYEVVSMWVSRYVIVNGTLVEMVCILCYKDGDSLMWGEMEF